MDSPFWENAIAAQFRHVAGSIGSRVLPQCRNRAAWQASKQWMPPSAACSGLPLALRLHPPSGRVVPHKSQSSPPRASLPGMSEVLIVSKAARNPEIDSLPTPSLHAIQPFQKFADCRFAVALRDCFLLKLDRLLTVTC